MSGGTYATIGEAVAEELFDNGYNTNYASGWFLVRSAPLYDTAGVMVGGLKEWYRDDSGGTTLQHTAGPLSTGQLDAASVPASIVALIGCASVGDRVESGATGVLKGDGALNFSIPAPYNIPESAPACESFNDDLHWFLLVDTQMVPTRLLPYLV